MEKYIACCLCVRNCSNFLSSIFNNLNLLSKEFKNFNVVFVYDNCTDNSDILLEEYKNSANYKVFVIHNIDNNSKYRTIRIANARNKCLDIVYNVLKNIDFHFMIDSDNVNIHKWNIPIIHKYLNKNDWDSISFNRKNYYDIWALMYGKFKHHCWGFHDRDFIKKIINFRKNDISEKLKNLENENDFECVSAFNGFAIYRTNKFKNIFYDGTYKNMKPLISDLERHETLEYLKEQLNIDLKINDSCVECCEHLYYHLSAIKNNNCVIKISKDIL